MTVPAEQVPPSGTDVADAVEAARRRGVFTVPRCADCGATFWHPRRHCPRCMSTSVDAVEPEGPARVHTWTRNHRPRGAGGSRPVSLGYVEFADGVKVLARLQLPEGPDPIGTTVCPRALDVDGHLSIVFVATGAGDEAGAP